MAIQSGTVSFNAAMRLWLVIILWGMHSLVSFAQEKTVEGIVFDKDTKERIAIVNILNLTTNTSIYNNLKAEFKITPQKHDLIVFSKTGYFSDTVRVSDTTTLAIYLKRTSIPLKPVYITGQFLSPTKKLEATKRLYNSAYGSFAYRDWLSLSSNGAGLSIDALYNMLSRRGRNAARLREVIDRDYRQDVIDNRFNATLVGNVTGLKGQPLTDFMFKYRPGYYFVTEANDYDFIRYIRNNYKRYQRNPTAYSLQPLDLLTK